MAKNEKSNIADIAKAVGVSPGTVSNALNNRKGVSENKRIDILETAKRLGYERNPAKNDEKTIKFIRVKRHGEVVADTCFFAELMHGIEKECRKRGYNLLIANIKLIEGRENIARDYFKKEESEGVILLATELRHRDLSILDGVSVPLVMLDSCYVDNEYDCVLMSNEDAVYKAVKYLAKMGHRRIGVLHSSIYINNFYYRKRGFYTAMHDLNLPVKKDDVYCLTPTIEGSYSDMKRELESAKDMPTAFFAENDIIAFGCIRALKGQGYRVPKDVSVIGFDDMLFCETSSPRLTTIHVEKESMGALAVVRLVDRIEKKGVESAIKIQVKTKLVERDSVLKRVPEFELKANDIAHSI